MILPIVQFGHPALRKKGRPVTAITDDIRRLADDMIETMRDARGVGLAAQQVGIDLQLFVIDIPEDLERPSAMWIGGEKTDPIAHMPMVVLNPVLTLTKKKERDTEGCLSIPELSAEVTRSHRVKVDYLGLDGLPHSFEASGLLGRAVQHEYDHLHGVLYIDHLTSEERAPLKPALEALRAASRAKA